MSVSVVENKYDKYGQPDVDFVFTGFKKSLTDRSKSNNLQFTRNSIGTYVGSDGLIKTAAANEARFDHNPVTGESLGLLVEESRTNQFQYSTDFSQGYGLNNSSLTANTTTAPDGTTTASTLTVSTGSTFSYMLYTISTTNGTSYSLSYWVKYNNCQYVWLLGGEVPDVFAYFDLINGVVGAANGYDCSITPYPNGWYRITATRTKAGATANEEIAIGITRSSTSPTNNQVGDAVYVWGAQFETGSFPTSYIPTEGSTVTRSADVVSLPNSGIYNTDTFTIINDPYGVSAGATTLSLIGPNIKRTTVYSSNLSQTNILNFKKKTDDFWQWRILGSSFALPSFVTNGQVTVDWGDGTVETLTTSEHTFTNGGGYHDVGFRIDSGTYFRPNINNNATHKTKVVATGPAPAGMTLYATTAFYGCSALRAVDATINVNATGGTNFLSAWRDCSSLTSFPLIDTSNGTSFGGTWFNCSSLTSFPLINTSSGTTFQNAWYNCSSLTSFPLINTSSGTNFISAWQNCSSLTSFPLINTSSGTTFSNAWQNCYSLTSFPLIDTSAGTNFVSAWRDCSSLTSFPLINTSSGTSFNQTWYNCSSLTSFPLIDTSSATNFSNAWRNCSSLTSFPLIDTSFGTLFQNSWQNCSSLTSFPLIDTSSGTMFQEAWIGCSSLTSFPLIDTSSGTSFAASWYNCSSLTSFPLIDTSSGTIFQEAWRFCSSLTSFPLIDASSGTNFQLAWANCSSLTSFPAGFFDTWTGTPVNNCFVNAWLSCADLTATSVENILNSIDTSGQSAPASGVDITINYDAGSGSPSVATAVTNLKSRGWTITLNGVAQ